MAAYILNEQCFDWFKLYAGTLLNKLGIKDWVVKFEFEDLSANESLAECRVHRAGRKASLVLSTVWFNDEPTEQRVKEPAWHEVLELLFDDMEAVLYMEELSSNEDKSWHMNRARHGVINRIIGGIL